MPLLETLEANHPFLVSYQPHKMISRVARPSLLSLLFFIALSCNDADEVILVNKLNANAGPDQEVMLNSLVTLDASASSDGNNGSFRYAWVFKSKPSGSNVIINSATSPLATFSANKSGLYVVQLTITQNTFSKTDEITIIVTGTATDPEPQQAIIINENVNADKTLVDVFSDPAKADYRITANVVVNAKLIVAPGVVVEFEEDKSLVINPQGSLMAVGDAEHKISFVGKLKTRGYWKGILIYSNNAQNILDYVDISDAGSSVLPEMPSGILANVAIAGTEVSGGSLKLSHSTVSNGQGFGFYVKGQSSVPSFSFNSFINNSASAVHMPASKLHTLDMASIFSGNGFNGVETGGVVDNNESVTWKNLQGGAKYYVSSYLAIESGITVAPGAIFELAAGVTIEVKSDGFLDAVGTSVDKIVFTSKNLTQNLYWTGILFRSTSDLNKLEYVDISRAGLEALPVFNSVKANVAIAGTGKASIKSSTIQNGLGWGIAAEHGSQINENITTANAYLNLLEGNVKLPVTTDPETTTLAGEWVDEWSFNNKHFNINRNFFNTETSTWFGGAVDPWSMNPSTGFGLSVSGDGTYVWTIAQQGPFTGECFSVNAEHIEGNVSQTSNTLVFVEEFWRSKLQVSCAPDQNVDVYVEPGTMTLQYEISRVYDVFSGEGSWKLTIYNPDGSSFVYYKK